MEVTCSNCKRKFQGTKCPYCGKVVGGEDVFVGGSQETVRKGGTGEYD
jgi:rRNA maturation endonuclease Nob1